MRAGTKFSSEIDEYSILTAILFVKMTGFIYPWLLSPCPQEYSVRLYHGSQENSIRFFLPFFLSSFCSIYTVTFCIVLIVDELFKKDYYSTCTVSFMKVVLFLEEIITSCIN